MALFVSLPEVRAENKADLFYVKCIDSATSFYDQILMSSSKPGYHVTEVTSCTTESHSRKRPLQSSQPIIFDVRVQLHKDHSVYL